jgi:hypothetical protein
VATRVLAAALLLGTAIFVVLEYLVDPQTAGGKDVADLDVLKASLGVLAAVGVVLGGVFAYRKQHLAEGDARRSDADLFADRYTAAAEQLGHPSPATRLAGVYAIARLADDWHEQRQTCIDVLCAYLRLPRNSAQHREEREVRRTIVRVIRDHLRLDRGLVSWQGYDMSFEGAVFESGDLSHAHFSGGRISFHGVRFSGTFHFSDAHFEGADMWFTKARFSHGLVSFKDATHTKGSVTFDSVTFGNRVSVDWGPFTPPPGAP